MSKICPKCDQIIKRSKQADSVTCGSFCGQTYHKDCVEFGDFNFKNLLNLNLFWKCNYCSNMDLSSFILRYTELSNCVSDLQKEISSLKEIIQKSLCSNSNINKNQSYNNPEINVNENKNPNLNPNLLSIPSISRESSLSSLKSLPSTSEKLNNKQNFVKENKNNNKNNRNKTKKSLSKIQPKPKKIFGSDSLSTLNALPSIKWLHISKFRINTNPADIVQHVSEKTGIPNNLLQCYKLIKKEADLSSLNYVNFKLSIPSDKLASVMNPSVWPFFVQVKSFTSHPKNEEQQQRN